MVQLESKGQLKKTERGKHEQDGEQVGTQRGLIRPNETGEAKLDTLM